MMASSILWYIHDCRNDILSISPILSNLGVFYTGSLKEPIRDTRMQSQDCLDTLMRMCGVMLVIRLIFIFLIFPLSIAIVEISSHGP